VRLVGVKGDQIGIVSSREAQQLALDEGVDLVEIAPNAEPPVCRLMDYRKFLFEQNKQRQAAKKKQKKISVKEMSFRPNTDTGDYQIKLNKIIGFLEHGDKVKVTLKFRGREMSHQELGLQLIENLKLELDAYGTVEQSPKLEGRQITMLIATKKK
jgi:translation initiation factor IF-3